MDPKQQTSQLDPKLKEAYDKVMSATIPTTPSTSPASSSTPTIPEPSNTPVNPIPLNTPPQNESQSTPAPQPIQPTIVAASSPSVPRRDSEKIRIGGSPDVAKKKSSGVSPIIYMLGGLIFLVVYIIFWLKFFNVPVPFLNF